MCNRIVCEQFHLTGSGAKQGANHWTLFKKEESTHSQWNILRVKTGVHTVYIVTKLGTNPGLKLN